MAFGLLSVSMPVFAQAPDEKAPVDKVSCEPVKEDGVTQDLALANHSTQKQKSDSGMPCVSVHEPDNEAVAMDESWRDGADTPGMVCNRASL